MNETQKLVVTIIVFVLLIAGGVAGLYFRLNHLGTEMFDSTDSLKRKIAQQQSRLDAANARIAQIPERKDVLLKLQDDRELAEQLVPATMEPHVLQDFINKKAEASGVELLSVAPSKATHSGPQPMSFLGGGQEQASGNAYDEWNFLMKLKGTYDQIGTFVNKMEEFQVGLGRNRRRQFFAVKSISIKAEKRGLLENGRHECSMTMQTFQYNGKPATP